MKQTLSLIGPELTTLLHWLTDCPQEFLMPPRMCHPDNSFSGIIHTDAVVSDLLHMLTDSPLTLTEAQTFTTTETKESINHHHLILLSCYVFSHPWFRQNIAQFSVPRHAILSFLKEGLTPLASEAAANTFVADPERREELARLCLKTLDLRPANETEIQALDRLTTVDTVERKKVMHESQAAHKRAEEIRKAIARKEAEEAASKMTRE